MSKPDWLTKGQDWLDETIEELFGRPPTGKRVFIWRGGMYHIEPDNTVLIGNGGSVEDLREFIELCKELSDD